MLIADMCRRVGVLDCFVVTGMKELVCADIW